MAVPGASGAARAVLRGAFRASTRLPQPPVADAGHGALRIGRLRAGRGPSNDPARPAVRGRGRSPGGPTGPAPATARPVLSEVAKGGSAHCSGPLFVPEARLSATVDR